MDRPPFDPKPVTLSGNHASLVSLATIHAQPLFDISQDESIWTWMIGSMWATVDDARAWIDSMLDRQARGLSVTFVAMTPDNRVAGTTSYYEIGHRDRWVEIGGTWYGIDHQRTAVNTQCKLLLMEHAFESLGAQRVTLKTDSRNERSRAAIERIGAQFEGVLRQYQHRHTGEWRDTAIFSITRDEWASVKQRLVERLDA
ncbi:MAG: GNAT family N-acetyltransferase [Phycisphaerales bacterium JB043]